MYAAHSLRMRAVLGFLSRDVVALSRDIALILFLFVG